MTLTDEQKEKIRSDLQGVEKDTSEPEASAQPRVTSIGDFCRLWPDARSVLEFLRDFDETPRFVKGAINLVIRAGDTVSRVVC